MLRVKLPTVVLVLGGETPCRVIVAPQCPSQMTSHHNSRRFAEHHTCPDQHRTPVAPHIRPVLVPEDQVLGAVHCSDSFLATRVSAAGPPHDVRRRLVPKVSLDPVGV